MAHQYANIVITGKQCSLRCPSRGYTTRSSCDYGRVLRRQLEEYELVVRQSPASKDENAEDEEATALEAVIRRQPVWRNGKLRRPFVCCSYSDHAVSFEKFLSYRSITILSVIMCSHLKHVFRKYCRWQWPRGLRHEPSSSAWTLGSCIRIALQACMLVCDYLYLFFLCAGATGWSPVQGFLPIVYSLRNWKATKVHKGCRAIHTRMDGWINRQMVG
jgi:hypothetical protein